MYLAENNIDRTEAVRNKWTENGVLEHSDLAPINDPYKRDATLRLLENQEKFLSEAPTNIIGDDPTNTGNVRTWDPILISLVRRTIPNLIAFDVVGVQPMSGPTGLVFAMKANYTSSGGAEASGQSEYDTDFSGQNALTAGGPANTLGSPLHVDTDDTNNPFAGTWLTGTGMLTSESEALGDATDNHFQEMAFSIEKTSVEAKSRALKAEYSLELQQDLRAVHGLDAETELANILSQEITGEINREIIRMVYTVAKPGAQKNTQSAGTFDLDTDANGRWSVEKYKGLMMQIEREANAIAKETRRGRGNIIICSSDVASALAMTGKLDINHALSTGLEVDDTGRTFAGVLNGRYKVYIDPYWTVNNTEIAVVGYKGTSSPMDAGVFYAPYVPLQMVRAVGENTFQPKIAFKTRYGLVNNPFFKGVNATVGGDTSNPWAAGSKNVNAYYRKIAIKNIL